MELWGVSGEKVLSDAQKNMQSAGYRLYPILELIREMIPGAKKELDRVSDEAGMYVLLGDRKFFSASLMCVEGIMEQIAAELAGDLIVLPSSIHEVIVLPYSESLDLKELDALVKSVNETTVSREEVLSDHAYLYERGRGYRTQQGIEFLSFV